MRESGERGDENFSGSRFLPGRLENTAPIDLFKSWVLDFGGSSIRKRDFFNPAKHCRHFLLFFFLLPSSPSSVPTFRRTSRPRASILDLDCYFLENYRFTATISENRIARFNVFFQAELRGNSSKFWLSMHFCLIKFNCAEIY